MKTAVSIPDNLFQSAEQFAQRQGLSRSELYARALQHYLHQNRNEQVTQQLDALYVAESSTLEPALARLQSLSLPKDEW